MQVKIDGRGQGQGGHDGGHQAHGAGQEDVGLADLPPAPHQAGGLEHGFHPGVGQDTEGDVGDEDVVTLKKRARVQVGAGLDRSLLEPPQGGAVQGQDAGDDQGDENQGRKDKDGEGDPGVLFNPQDVEPGHHPDGDQDQGHDHVVGQVEKRGGIEHRAHRRDAGGEDVVHHDGGHRHEGHQGAQDQVGEGIDPAADEPVVLQDLGDLHQPGGHVMDEDRGEGDKDDGAGADEAVGLGGGVKHRGELVHQGDDRHRQPGEPPAPVEVVRQPPRFPEQIDEKTHQRQVGDDEENAFQVQRRGLAERESRTGSSSKQPGMPCRLPPEGFYHSCARGHNYF